VKVRTRHIVEATASALWIQSLADLASGTFELLPITEAHYALAEEFIGRHGFRYRLRTLDALQLAVAVDRSKYKAIDGFVLADQVLSEVASAENTCHPSRLESFANQAFAAGRLRSQIEAGMRPLSRRSHAFSQCRRHLECPALDIAGDALPALT
jgi:hypothetical protein